MSDFDEVLERLLNEPSFAGALAADPDGALAGYRLDAGEAELLRSQVSADKGGGLAAVETRTTKSSTFGLFSSAAEIGHVLADGGGLGHWSEFGSAVEAVAHHASEAPGGHGGAAQGLGAAPGDLDGLPPTASSGLGAAPQSGLGGSEPFTAEPEHYAPPAGYHPRIDADGDGHWDKATYAGTKDGGVEILVDTDHDGHPDFVGHDTDSDGRVDYADIDKNHDGVFEKRMYDDNGDGWLDRTVRHRND